MKDPHVKRLHYRIQHHQFVVYEKARPRTWDTPLFIARVEGDRATLEMKTHYAREQEAKDAVAPFLRNWEVWAGLERAPGEFEFRYESCEIVDPTNSSATGTSSGRGSAHAVGAQKWGTYPEAPDHFQVSDDVALMYTRYKQYREGKEQAGNFANFFYTAIKGGSRAQQTRAAKKFCVENNVLTRLRELGQKGRKYEWADREFTDAERRWLEKVVKVLIRRAGEVAADPTRNTLLITMDYLSRL